MAERAARRAGQVLLAYFGRPPEGLDTKSSGTDPVSDADREAERAIQELLAEERPDDGLVAEEGSRTETRNGRRWIVDPLDGTVNFLYGFPVWGVSVALEDEDGVAVGVVYDPSRDELFRAVRGAGADVDGRPLQVRNRTELRSALVATGFSYDSERRAAQAELVSRLIPEARDIRRAGAASLDLAWLAAGRVDGFLEHALMKWDWAAGRLLVEEAGGVAEPLPGDPPGLAAAGTPELLEALVEYAVVPRPA